MSNEILRGEKLVKNYKMSDGKTLYACRGVDFTLNKGETVGIVGESGCGKSTLLKLLTQLEEATSGEIVFRGVNITKLKGRALRKNRRHIQMVFQDPALAFSPRMKVRDALLEPLKNYYKLNHRETEAKVDELLTLVGLPSEYANRYCHEMSGGQRQRLGIARALALDPDVLICDEATCALDVSIQDTIVELLVKIQKERNQSMVFVCHDVALVHSLAHRLMIMYAGSVVEIVPCGDLVNQAKHPYAKRLISSIFSTDMDFSEEIEILEGDVPSPLNLPNGCAFASRCPNVQDICLSQVPELKEIAEGHSVACHLY